ncbi:hypothetical protein FS837_008675 [Tulasnella sp. UAMH 9824]|nr:hypothetical protein FS837_008675 [Tulasnella sp. UAMH 9824]
MSKSQFYLQQCSDAASKSSMCFHLGAILVKGGKIISTGYNHHRTHYDGSDSAHGQRKPVSMHAEMHAIYNATGMSPAFSRQVKAESRRVSPWRPPQYQSSSPSGSASGSGSQSDAAWVDEEEEYSEPQQDVQPPPAARQPQQQRRPTPPTPQRPAKGPPIFKGTEGRCQEESCTVRTQELARQQSTKFIITIHQQQQGSQESASTEQQRQWERKWVGQPEPWTVQLQHRPDVKLWDSRRRDPRVNGADLYVARFTKNGLGPAKPCGRCLEWCRWAGVKRIFHWDPDAKPHGKWDVLKVNDPENAYLTHADVKINNGTFKAYAYSKI